MYHFSGKTLEILNQHGWSEGRQVDITEYKNYLLETQQPISNIILDFLISFGGLEVFAPIKSQPEILYNVFSINPRLVGAITVQISQSRLKRPICVVGRVDEIDIFAMTPEGEALIISDMHISRIGNNMKTAIETLCTEGYREELFR